LAIVGITAAWWALALYPIGAQAPDWVARTRAACFGNMGDALPSAGGWTLLVGEPVGMLGVLVVVWGEALRDDLRILMSRSWGRAVMLLIVGALAVGAVAVGARVRNAINASDDEVFAVRTFTGEVTRLNVAAPALQLTDQRGQLFSIEGLRGGNAIVTFAFAHCSDVCPTVVRQLRQARSATGRRDIPIVIVTLDPWRDTPSRLPTIAAQWELDSTDVMLSGNVEQVNRVLDVWAVGRARDTKTGDVSHAAVAYVVDRRGHLVARLDGGFDRVRELLPD
jgi:protein SCO1/2